MTSRTNFVFAMALIALLIMADFYHIASLFANAAMLALAAILLVSASLRGTAKVSDWFQVRKGGRHTSFGRIRSMAMRVESAAGGYSNSREELANLLAESFVVRSGESLQPSYDLRMDARERLKVMAQDDSKTREIFDSHPQTSQKRFRFRQRRNYEYVSGIESAIKLVREGE